MKLRRIRMLPYALPLREVLVTAQLPIRERRGWLVELESDGGQRGWGDAAPLAGFGMESETQCEKSLLHRGAKLLESSFRESLTSNASPLADPAAPGASFALDSALRDLLARHEDSSLASRLAGAASGEGLGGGRPEGEARTAIRVSGLLVGEEIGVLCENARALAGRGFETFKLKVGARTWPEDLERVRAVREVLGPTARLRLDANGAWTRERAAAILLALSELEIEFIEQPVAAEDLEGLAQLRRLGVVPVAADECASDREGALRVIERGAADVLILKPAALGGLGVAAEIADLAGRAGIPVVLTSLLDSIVGTLAVAHLAAALPGERPADGLATGSLFEFDLATPQRIEGGLLELPPGAGLGIAPDPALLARAQLGDWVEVEK